MNLVRAAVSNAKHRVSGRRQSALTAEEANRQYHEEAAKLELPEGWEWPQEPFAEQAADGARITYGPGMGRQDARHVYRCAWSRTVLAVGSEADRNAALAHVAKLPEARREPVLIAALAGDFDGLAKYVRLNCADRRRT